MKRIFNKLFTIAMATALWIAIAPTASLAQTSGMGSDGNTRLLWRANDGSIALWDINANLNVFAAVGYGPYQGWTPIAMTAGINNFSYVLWNNVNGSSSLWVVDQNLNFLGGIVAGPYAGWTAESLSTGTSSTNLRLLWKRSDGMLAIWNFDQYLDLLSAIAYGPYSGYNPAPVGQSVYRRPEALSLHKAMPLQVRSRPEGARRAAAIMTQHVATKKFAALPPLR